MERELSFLKMKDEIKKSAHKKTVSVGIWIRSLKTAAIRTNTNCLPQP